MWKDGGKMAVFWVNFYQATRCYNPEDRHFHTHRRENLKSFSDGGKIAILSGIFLCGEVGRSVYFGGFLGVLDGHSDERTLCEERIKAD
jgi:hypothetical protein